ncbi:WD40-repeat-containing domain protein [Russula aff. rugulosa BPL654]|nr:WD40-repeat-containing domain protein [Russula aff. rugulosa BPL654]
MPSPVTLPTATIQDDFTTVLSEVHAGIIPSENIWLSCYKNGEPSVHGKISVSLHEQDRDRVELVGRGGVELTRKTQFRYTARCSGLGINYVDFISPSEVYADPSHSDEKRPRQIPSFAISNGHLVTALLDGTLSVYDHPPPPSVTATYPVPTTHVLQPTVTTKLHRSVVNALEILSGTSPDPLLASAGSDFTINITRLPTSELSNNTPPSISPLLSFKGHLRPVVSLLPLPNHSLLSASADGSIRMWDIQSGTQKEMWTMPKPAVALAAAGDDANGGAWVALADGSVQLVDTRASTSVVKWSAGVTTRAITIALGAANGTVMLFDVHGGSVREQWRRSGAPAECVSFAPGGRVLVGGEDGLPYLVDVSRGGDDAGLLVSELVFGNIEAVRALRVSGDLVYMAGDGGVIRKYQL